MSEAKPLSIAVRVSDGEAAVIAAVAAQLGEALADDAGRPWPVRVHYRPDLDIDDGLPNLIVCSMLADLVPFDRPVDAIAAKWHARLTALSLLARGRISLCTIFRAVRDGRADRIVLERIRRLNLLVVNLSHDHGVAVVDIDRSLSFFGADLMGTDFTLRGRPAAEAAAHAIVSVILGGDLDESVPADRQAAAVKRHGGLFQLGPAVDRRLAAATSR